MSKLGSNEDRGALSVQITASFHDTVISVRLLRSGARDSYLIGEDDRADLHVPAEQLPGPNHTLVRGWSGSHWLCFTREMTGYVEADGQVIAFRDLAARSETRPATTGYQWPIAPGARCRIELGAAVFRIESFPAPAPVARQLIAPGWRENHAYNGLSALAHALALFLVFSVPPMVVTTHAGVGLGQRRAIFATTPQRPEETLPGWLEARPRPEPTEATGSGTRGRKRAGAAPPRRADIKTTRRLAMAAAKDSGVLSVLRGAPGSPIRALFDKGPVLGQEARDALEGLQGDLLGEGYFSDGLIMAPTDRGQEGIGSPSLGSLIGTPIGPDADRRGPGRRGRLRDHDPQAPKVTIERPVVQGSLDKEIIRRIVRRHRNEIRYCYEKELSAHPDLQGRVTVQFTIGGTGQVLASVVRSSDLRNSVVERCVAAAVRRWRFPRPGGGSVVVVSYPFVLRVAGE